MQSVHFQENPFLKNANSKMLPWKKSGNEKVAMKPRTLRYEASDATDKIFQIE